MKEEKLGPGQPATEPYGTVVMEADRRGTPNIRCVRRDALPFYFYKPGPGSVGDEHNW
jgi:hypothetical protein